MDLPTNYLENLQARAQNKTARNFRDELLLTTLTELNNARMGTKYPQLKFVFVKMKVAHLSDSDLGYFVDRCQKANCGFSKAFFGGLKL